MPLKSRINAPLEGPPLRRQIAAPGRLLGVLALLAPLPIAALAGYLGPAAPARALHVFSVFLVLLVAFRVLGKRELGRLSPFELVMLMLIPEVLSNVVQGEGSLLEALAGLSTLLLLVLGTSVLAHRFEGIEKLVEARPTVLVADGKLIEDALNHERIVPDEILSEMRKQGFRDLAEIRWGILEPSGNVTFVPRLPPAPTPRPDDQAEAL